MWAADCEKVVIEFLSTPSARRATLFSSTSTQMGRISIHALREEGDAIEAVVNHFIIISIHALREEGDVKRFEDYMA